MSKLALTDVIVELHVSSFEVVRNFYGKLGFKEVWSNPPKGQSGYLVMKRDNNILAFFCGNEDVYNHEYFKKFSKTTPRGYGVEVAIHIVDMSIEKYYDEISSKIDSKYIVQPLETKPWGTKDFRVIDPFGYYLCIRENENILIS